MHALVTGGSAGFGLALARAYVARGWRVTIVGRDRARLAAAAERLGEGTHTIAADLAVAGEPTRVVEEALSHVGQLDAVCHAAGRSSRGWVHKTPRQDFERLLALNFLAAVELTTAAADALMTSRGSLVLIGSLATHVAPAGLGAYPASKHPLAAFAQQCRLELGPRGCHTLLVCPGPMARDDAGARYDDQAAELPDELRQPGGGAKVKLLDPDDLAKQVLRACDRRVAELVVPKKARLLFALGRLFPEWGDRLLRRNSAGGSGSGKPT
ncbi:MAG: SDR family oxidoreductase [Planctomycetota bacterium]